jgi:hypothetical protein
MDVNLLRRSNLAGFLEAKQVGKGLTTIPPMSIIAIKKGKKSKDNPSNVRILPGGEEGDTPVMARSGLTGLARAKESREVMMAHPAEGPSLGVAPAGTCTWMACSAKYLSWSGATTPLGWPVRKEREKVCAMVALSFITSPSWPALLESVFITIII